MTVRVRSDVVTFIDKAGIQRTIDDGAGNVRKLLHAILEGSGVADETVITEGTEPPTNLRMAWGNYTGKPQHPKPTY